MKRLIFLIIVALAIFSLTGCATTNEGKTDILQPEINYQITGSGGATTGPLKIKRIEIGFQNQRGEITVPMNSKLKAYAVIKFDGNGLFRATWMVDGRVLEEIAITVSYGDTLTIWTSSSTIIPTFEPGPHTLTLKIKEPKPSFKVPVIRYFVTGEMSKEK